MRCSGDPGVVDIAHHRPYSCSPKRNIPIIPAMLFTGAKMKFSHAAFSSKRSLLRACVIRPTEFCNGEGVQADHATSLAWYEMAAENGDAQSQYDCQFDVL